MSARPSRSLLLVGAVALSAALISAVACALASANGAVGKQLESQIGTAELRVRAVGTQSTFDERVLETVRSWPGVEAAVPRARSSIAIQFRTRTLDPVEGRESEWAPATRTFSATGYGNGVDLETEFAVRPPTLLAGRLPTAHGEVLLDARFAERLGFNWSDARMTSFVPNAPGLDIEYLGSPTPALPDRVTESAEADRLNALVGVRPDDEILVVRQFAMPLSSAALARVGIDANMRATFARLFRSSARLRVVGISEPPPLGGVAQVYMSLPTFAAVTGQKGRLDQVEIELAASEDPQAVAEALGAELGDDVVVQTTEKVTSRLDQNLSSNNLAFALASVLAMLSAAFIIMTGLTTGIAEQQRGLAVLRCIGAHKSQLGQSQLMIGGLIGVSGALIGVPLGVGFAWLMVTVFDEQLPSGLEVPPGMLLFAGIGSVAAGLIGAAYPAVRVVRVSPLKALTGRAEPTKPAAIGRVLGFALAGIALQFAIVAFSQSRETLFWSYATAGLPAMFIGYFLLSVPIMIGASYALSGPLSKLLGLPPRVLGRTVRATPFRHGFTAGAMMTGLALMVSIWTNGGSILRDWLNNIEFPDAFVNGLRLQPEAQERIRALPFVTNTCSIALHSIETDAFGIEGLSNYRTTFIAFEPEPFFAMTNVEFLQGDAETAERRLEEGGTIIVSKEFTAAQGLGVGDTFVCRDNGETFEFEIVGVVTSPGLELASKFFNIGEEYLDQAIHAVFGSRKDLRERFNSDATQLIQVAFDNDELVRLARERGGPDIDPDYWATQQIKEATLDLGVLDAGSGRRIKSRIGTFIGATLVVFSGVAVVSMLVACFGVANLIIAGIESRQFEFGVLRAVGAQRGMLARLVAAEAILVAVTASIVGTLMGMQTAWAGSRLYELIAGLEMRFTPPVGAIAFGWGVVLLFTVGAALPAIFRLNGRQTRELLAATRG